MAQITLYVDEETDALLKTAVRHAKVSQSRWIADAIRLRAGAEWPRSVMDLAGAWPDFEELAKIRNKQGKDSRRETL